jgi:hypothetical protein
LVFEIPNKCLKVKIIAQEKDLAGKFEDFEV